MILAATVSKYIYGLHLLQASLFSVSMYTDRKHVTKLLYNAVSAITVAGIYGSADSTSSRLNYPQRVNWMLVEIYMHQITTDIAYRRLLVDHRVQRLLLV